MELSDDKKFLKMAIRQSEKSIEKGGFPAGAVVVRNGKILSKGISVGNLLKDPTSHAETSSMRKACKKLNSINLNGATLYASLQPCLMCFSVANWSGISRIVYGCRKKLLNKLYYEGAADIQEINKINNRQIELIFIPDFEEESLSLVKKWESIQK